MSEFPPLGEYVSGNKTFGQLDWENDFSLTADKKNSFNTFLKGYKKYMLCLTKCCKHDYVKFEKLEPKLSNSLILEEMNCIFMLQLWVMVVISISSLALRASEVCSLRLKDIRTSISFKWIGGHQPLKYISIRVVGKYRK